MIKLFIISLLCYAFASISFLLSILGKKDILNTASKFFSAFGFLVLNIVLLLSLTGGARLVQSEIYLFSVAWLLSVVTIFVWFRVKNPIFFTSSAPILFVLVHTAMMDHNKLALSNDAIFTGALFNAHIITLLFAIIALFTAGIASILFLAQEKAMKKKKFQQFKHIPPLDLLDKINHYATIIGFPMYTLGIISGFVWASSAWGSFFSGDIKEIISISIWFGYAILFHMRVGLSLTGKKPAMLLLLLCLLTLFSLLAVNTLFSTHHQF